MSTIGHNKQREFFKKIKEANRLSHAYLLIGPNKVGKKKVVLEFVADLFLVGESDLSSHPDIIFIRPGINEKTGKTNKNINVNDIKSLRRFLSTGAVRAKYKIGVIDVADRMNIASSNALLKTLEEPNENSILFLITNDESKLLKTIISRVQSLYFGRVSPHDVFDFLSGRGLDSVLAREMAILSEGRVGYAVSWSQDMELYEKFKLSSELFINIFGKPFYQKLSMVEHLFGDKSDPNETRERLIETLDEWLVILWKMYYNNNVLRNDLISKENLLKIESSITQAKIGLKQNVHPRLLIENILLFIP